MIMKTVARRVPVLLVVLLLVAANVAFLPKAHAAQLSHASVLLTNMNAGPGAASAIVFEFKTSASNTGSGLTISFPSYTGGANGTVNATQTYSTTLNAVNCTTIFGGTVVDLPGTPTATGNAATGLITFTLPGPYVASTEYCGVLLGTSSGTTDAITTNPTATGPTTAIVTAGTDSATTVGIDIVTGSDQVVVTANVPPAFTMSLGGASDAFTANLASGSIATTTGMAVTVNTNAANGWTLWGSDSNAGLKSTSQGHLIPSLTPGTNGTLSAGTEHYVTGLPAAGITQGTGAGVTSAIAAYASSGSGNGSGLDTTERQVAQSNGTAAGAIVTLKEYAAISGITPAASDYSDTITLVGAGNF